MGDDGITGLPAIAFATLGWFYFVWAAMHDLAHGDSGELEWTVLALCALAFPLLCFGAVRFLSAKERLAWLVGTGFLIALFAAGATASTVRPKYPRDPMLGTIFLLGAVPALGWIGQRIVSEVGRRLTRGRP